MTFADVVIGEICRTLTKSRSKILRLTMMNIFKEQII